MNSKQSRYLVWTVICSLSMLLISVGCNSPQEYKYQKESDVTTTSNVVGHGGGTVATTATKESTPAVAVKSEPTNSEVLVADILQDMNSFNNRKVSVSGRIGKVFTHDKMAFLLNTKNDLYIEFSFEQMPDSDRIVLTSKMVPLQKVTISGVWDATRKVLVADSLISPSK